MKSPRHLNNFPRYLLHAVVWLFAFLIPFLLRASNLSPAPLFKITANNYGWLGLYVCKAIIWAGYFYLNTFVLVPLLTQKKKAWLFTGLQLGCLVFVHLVSAMLLFVFIPNVINPSYRYTDLVLFNTFPFLLIFLAGLTYQLYSDKAVKNDITQGEKTNLMQDIERIRTKIKPDFIHSILDTLLQLLHDKPAKAEPAMLTLTSLIKYMLLEPVNNKVSLEEEIENLERYIYFLERRLCNSISLSIPENVLGNNYEVEHLILLRSLEDTLNTGSTMRFGEDVDIYLFNKNHLLNFIISTNTNNARLLHTKNGMHVNNVRRKLIVNSYQKNYN